jgi:anti-sigma factor ChrR (cupin superfamily)
MQIRTDYTKQEHVPFDAVPWAASPERGVERKMLDRDGDEVARATSIVRYAAGSQFAEHEHPLGEEFLVLEGTFQDDHGDYPAGTYVRNPPRSRHRPFSRGGCVIFVKLRQFSKDDTVHRCVRPDDGQWRRGAEQLLPVKELHSFGDEHVSLVEIPAGAEGVLPPSEKGTELLVLWGSMEVAPLPCEPLTWFRSSGRVLSVRSDRGCVIWLKQGHLPLPGSTARAGRAAP